MQKRLGSFLLRGFQRDQAKGTVRKRPFRQGRFSKVSENRISPHLRISKMRATESEAQPKSGTPLPQEPEATAFSEQEARLPIKSEASLPLKSEASPQLTLTGISPLASAPKPPQPEMVQGVLPFAADSSILSTSDLIRPSDRLRQSIEAFLMDQRSPHTRRAYGKDLKRFVKFLHSRGLQQGGMETLTRTVLIAYKESLLSEGLEHTSVDRHIATLRSFFRWLVDDGILEKNPAEGVRFLNPKRISRTIGFSDEEVKKILSLPDLHTRTGAMHYAVLMVLFYCGLRRSELCDLMIQNLGTERNQRVVRLRGKGNSERLVVVVPPVWNAIRYYFHITRRSLSDTGHLFVPIRNNRTGIVDKPLDSSMIFYIVTRYAKLAGIANRVSPHSCRATAISNARDHQVPDRAIQEFAGWASTDMITRYDKRKTSVENSAAHAISYGAEGRPLPDESLREFET